MTSINFKSSGRFWVVKLGRDQSFQAYPLDGYGDKEEAERACILMTAFMKSQMAEAEGLSMKAQALMEDPVRDALAAVMGSKGDGDEAK